MVKNEVSARFDAPAAAVWAFTSWHGMPRLVEGGFFTGADFPEGRDIRPGALRRVSIPDGAFVERLVEYSEAEFYYRYELIDPGPLPVKNYEGFVAVTPNETGCQLSLGHATDLIGVSENDWRRDWLKIEQQVFDFISDRTCPQGEDSLDVAYTGEKEADRRTV